MSYYDDDRKYYSGGRTGAFKTVFLSLISAVLGGAIAVAIVPNIYGNNPQATGNQQVVLNSSTPMPVVDTEGAASFPVAQIAKTTGPAVVGIANFQTTLTFFGGSNLTEVGSGSGFIINAEHGYIVTNNHVVAGSEKVVVSLADGRNIEGKIVGGDRRTDLAVVQIEDTKDLVAAQLGDSSQLQVGEPVVAIGNPGGEEFARSVTTGVVSATNRNLDIEGEASFDLIQTDAAINPGNSGGPLVSYQNLIIGINSVKNKESGFEGMGFAIPISNALPTITQLIEKGYASHPGLDIQIDPRYTPEFASQRKWPTGAYVSKVTAGGPADKADIRSGDIITKINDKELKNYQSLTRELFRYKVGDTVSVTVFRDNKTFEVSAVLVEIRSE